ncbi:arylamine N-acetyltransferase family protein [Bacillus sp. NPDC077027]|uniref:arylamine N-acetyltransferase family protein n=1 Tax=Bacillus sp. NPDC077027 TaxID=3390548 RepID=UPI003D085CEA
MVKSAFLKKIGMEEQMLTFESLPSLLKKMAYTFPFENRAVLAKHSYSLNKDGLSTHLLEEQRGGLCYDLNPLLYYVLNESGFTVSLLQGTVFQQEASAWAIDGTHVAILLEHERQLYVIDAGFGTNLPLAPVPLTGEWIETPFIRFRVKKETTEKGTHLLQLDRDGEIEIGYAFTLEPIDETILNEMKREIYENEASSFNKSPLASKLTPLGRIVVTGDHVTVHESGQVSKQPLTQSFDSYVETLISTST